MFDKIRVSSFAVTLGVALLAAAAVPQLRASEFDKKTIMTFSAPVEISGHTLPAGTYVFKTLDNNRDVVMVMNSEESRICAAPDDSHRDIRLYPTKFGLNSPNAPRTLQQRFTPGSIPAITMDGNSRVRRRRSRT